MGDSFISGGLPAGSPLALDDIVVRCDNVVFARRPDRHCAPTCFDDHKEVILAKEDPKTAIDPNGLRYRSKVAGSPFSATGAFGAATMSCFLCGKHRPRAHLKTRKLLGKAQAVCAPSCKELDELLRA